MRSAKLHIGVGKNLVENKMADAHFFIELMERGGKIVTITPEYSPPATKADYWMPCRPGLGDTAIFLGITKLLMDRNLYDAPFVKEFTDFPLLLRADNLKRLSAADVFPAYAPGLTSEGPSFKIQGLTKAQYDKLQDYVVYDAKSKSLKPLTREDVGVKLTNKGLDPQLDYRGTVTLANGQQVEILTLWEAYKVHLQDYDLDTVAEISGSPKDKIEQLAMDIATIKPVAIHQGEGINHWFHATEMNRAAYLPLMLTGNIGKPGAGCHTWAGNYKAALFQGSPWTGPGFKGWVAEDPFELTLDPNASRTSRPRLHPGRGAGLLGPRRPGPHRRHPEGGTEGLHRQEPHAEPDQAPLDHERQPHQQRQVGLRRHLQRPPEDRPDHHAGHRDDGELRVFRLHPAGQLVAGVRAGRGYRLVPEPLPSDLEGRHQADVRYERRHRHHGGRR
jgi:hypothetical protein